MKKKFVVMESDGEQIVGTFNVNTVIGFNEGKVLVYQREGKMSRCYIGNKVKPLLWKGKFYVGKEVGNSSACQVVKRKLDIDGELVEVDDGCEIIGEPSDVEMPGEDLTSVFKSDMLNKYAKTVTKKRSPWLFILIVVVVVIAVIAFIYMRSRGA